MRLTHKNLIKEICAREKSESREVNAADVSRVLSHMLTILSEEDISDVLVFIVSRLKYYNKKGKK